MAGVAVFPPGQPGAFRNFMPHSTNMKFILAEKIEMSQMFNEAGIVYPVTLFRVPSNVVTAVRTQEKDGYEAIQVEASRSKREFRGRLEAKTDDTITVSLFREGDIVSISGTSKGKGFQGVVKRHGFHGGPRTHGQKHSEREPGSIGAVWPQRVLKGTRMAGRMGGERVTVRNLKVIKVFPDDNLLAVAGAVPGRRGSLVEIRSL